jgi:hypothetical protein
MKISEYIDRRYKLTNTRFIITPEGKGLFIEDGIPFTRDELRHKYPLPLSLVSHNCGNADGTKSYLNTD